MRALRFLAVGGATVAGLALLTYASALPMAYHPAETGRLRLSWSARPERLETCRALSAEELARLEEHMRQRVRCEGRSATYLLTVLVDGERVDQSVVRGSGLRNDRPIYLLRDYPIAAGAHRVRVTLARRETMDSTATALPALTGEPDDTGLFAGRAERELVERARRASAAIPPALSIDTLILFTPRHTRLITFDGESRILELRRPSSGAP